MFSHICNSVNYIVQETISAGDQYFEFLHPYNDYECATKMVRQCVNECTDDDYISLFVMDNFGDSYEVPII